MKQNIYDNADFFERYLHYRESSKCLNSALEQPYLKDLLPDPRGKRILDIGSGMGLFSEYAARLGAASIVGIDISNRMCDHAKARLQDFQNISIHNSAVEDFEWNGDPFDLIVSSLALHYVVDLAATIQKTAQWLREGGYYIISVNHPFYTAGLIESNGDGLADSGNYWHRGPRIQTFLGTKIIKYHETLENYWQAFNTAGLQIITIKDLSPFSIGVESWEGDEGLAQRPIFMLIKAQKGVDHQ